MGGHGGAGKKQEDGWVGGGTWEFDPHNQVSLFRDSLENRKLTPGSQMDNIIFDVYGASTDIDRHFHIE